MEVENYGINGGLYEGYGATDNYAACQKVGYGECDAKVQYCKGDCFSHDEPRYQYHLNDNYSQLRLVVGLLDLFNRFDQLKAVSSYKAVRFNVW